MAMTTIGSSAGEIRNIIVCCDGTGNEVATESTNVLRLFRALVNDDRQLCWYDAGVGAAVDPARLLASSRWTGRILDMMVGSGVRSNACRAYRFISETWRPGDRIWLFGFSRGAYTIRAVAGMIQLLGLARPEHSHLAELAWTVYAGEKGSSGRFRGGNRFATTFSWPATVSGVHAIHFLGAWDTVSSFGMIWNLETLPSTANNDAIAHIRHAVAIDERRALFSANLFYPTRPEQHASFKERWFAGTHGDVGGGWPEPNSALAKIALEWMFDEAAGLGCRFDDDKRRYFLGQPSAYQSADRRFMGERRDHYEGPVARPRQTPPSVSGSINNPFTANFRSRGWYILEALPYRSWDGCLGRMRWRAPHLLARRRLPVAAILHPSVKDKIEEDSCYRPANLPLNPIFAN